MRNENIEVLAMQEHWLTKNHKFPKSHLEGFMKLRAVRPSRKRRGCSLYISHSITVLRHEVASNDQRAAVMAKLKDYN